MPEKDKRKKRDPVPDTFDSILEAAEFWDNHDSADYEDIMEEADFEVNLKRQIYMIPIASDILDGLREKAKYQGLSTEIFVNLLLQKHAL